MNSRHSITGRPPTPAARSDEPSVSIHARGLTRIYAIGSVKVAGLDGIDLTVSSGELVVLKGDSGSGKSTLLSLLAGLDRMTAGKLTVAGHDLNRCSESELIAFRRNTVGVIFQAFNLLPTLSVLENACLPALLAGQPYHAARPRAKDLLAWLGMSDRLDHHPHQLSGGEMQRTAIARALINDPAVILADEPTGNLDSGNAGRVMARLADLNRRFARTVVVATHSDLADAYATMMLRLKDGRIVP